MVQATFEFSPTAAAAASSTGAPFAATPPSTAHATPAPTNPATDAASSTAADLDSVGFEIGWDHAHHRVTPPLSHLHAPNPVHQGWLAGRAAFGARTLAATASHRQWLALRLLAWQQGAAFEGVQVNPAFLARIDAVCCPVSRQPLTLCAGRPEDATVTRLNPGAAYAAGNLVVLSQGVLQAEASGMLGGAAQARLASLRSFATPLPHAQAALLPLRALPPNRVRVINPVQALQVMLTLQFLHAGYARRLLGLAVLMPGSEVRQAFQIFMHTLLARRLAAGQGASPADMRRALEDSWADVLVNRRWQRLATRLTAADCEQLLQQASRRGLVVGGSRWVSSDVATEGWALEAGLPGRAAPSAVPSAAPSAMAGASAAAERPAAPAAAADQAGAGADTARTRPGMARSRGSQKLAS